MVVQPSTERQGPCGMPGGRHAYMPAVNVCPRVRSWMLPRMIQTSSQKSCDCGPMTLVSVPGSKCSIRV